jgi:hypothetical protein
MPVDPTEVERRKQAFITGSGQGGVQQLTGL